MKNSIEGELDRLQKDYLLGGSADADINNPELYIDGKLPVDIIQFVEDPFYLGNLVKTDPQVLQLLWEIERPGVREAFVEVGKGSGKSFVGSIIPAYGAYLVLSMKRPHYFYQVTDDTIIATINVSVGNIQAKNVIFKQMKGFVEKSPWFVKNAKNIPLSQQVDFTDKSVSLFCGHSNSTAFLGFATIRAVLDEANFMVNNANRNVAEDLFSALRGSCKTRFPNHYKLLAISSAATPNAWLHSEIKTIKRNGKEVPLNPDGLHPDDYKEPDSDGLDSIFDDIFSEEQK